MFALSFTRLNDEPQWSIFSPWPTPTTWLWSSSWGIKLWCFACATTNTIPKTSCAQLYPESPQPIPNHLAQHMGGMNLMDSSVKSPPPPQTSLQPHPWCCRDLLWTDKLVVLRIHHSNLMIRGVGLLPRPGGLMSPTGPQQHENGSGL